MEEKRKAAPRRKPPGRPEKEAKRPVWGVYVPDIRRSYPNLPVRGRIENGRRGPEFRPDPGQLDPRNHPGPDLRDWITSDSYDLAVQKSREEADLAIRDMRAGIDRLQRFIDNN